MERCFLKFKKECWSIELQMEHCFNEFQMECCSNKSLTEQYTLANHATQTADAPGNILQCSDSIAGGFPTYI